MAAPDINTCGFETGDFQEVNTTSGTVSVQSSIVRSGGYALRSNPTTSGAGYAQLGGRDGAGSINQAFAAATVYIRFYFRVATLPGSGSEPIMWAADAGIGLKAELRITSAGLLAFYDSATSLQATGSTALSTGVWYRIETKIGTGASAAWEILIDGVSEMSGTANTTGANNGAVLFGKVVNRSSQSVDFFYDDIAIGSTGYIGAGANRLVQPTADGTYTTFTIGAGSGSKYQQVDELPNDGDTTYLVSTGTLNDAYSAVFNLQTVVLAGSVVNATKGVFTTKRDGASDGFIRFRLRSGSTNSDTSADFETGSAYTTTKGERYNIVDPNTGSAWVRANMSALEVGVIERNANKSRVTMIAMTVDFMTVLSVTSITPDEGPAAGATVVTIAGTGFQTGADVDFNATAAAFVSVHSDIEIEALTPAHAAGLVDVAVTNPDTETAALTDGFTFLGEPTIDVDGVDPDSGYVDGGTSVTITGTGFQTGATVTFGGLAATSIVVVSDTEITCDTPAHSVGSVTVRVTNPDAQVGTLVQGFTYIAVPTPPVDAVAIGVLVDWDRNGGFDEAGNDVTANVNGGNTVSWTRGKDQAQRLSPPSAGQFNAELLNTSRDYSAENESSPLAGMLFPGCKVRVTDADGKALWTGILDDIPQHPKSATNGLPTVEIPSLGMFGRLRNKSVNTELFEDILVSDAIERLLDAAGIPDSERVIQTSLQTLDWYWEDDADAFDAFLTLVRTEGSAANAYEDPNGFTVFENRDARTTQTRSTVSQATYSDDSLPLQGADYGPHYKDVIKAATLTVVEREPQALDKIWENGGDLVLTASQIITRTIRPSSSDPFKEAALPEAFGINEIQRLTPSAVLTNGTFKLRFRGQTTGSLVFNATAAAIQAELELLTTIGAGNIICGGGPINTTPVDCTFRGDLKEQDITDLIEVETHLNTVSKPATINIVDVGDGTNPKFTIFPSAPLASGVFKLRVSPQSLPTANINWDASAATIQLRIENLPLIDVGDVSASGGPIDTDDVTIELTGGFYYPTWVVVLHSSSLTTNSDPTATINVTEYVKGSGPDYILTDGDTPLFSFDRTSGPYCTLTITDSGSGCTLTNPQVRARLVTVVRTHQATFPQGTPNVPDGQVSKPTIRPEIPLADANQYVEDEVTFYEEARPVEVLTSVCSIYDSAALADLFAREISDRITIQESHTGVDDDYFIEHVRFTVAGTLLSAQFGCEKADM